MNQREFLKDAFLRYTAITSQSDRHQNFLPTTEGQMILALLLKDELHEMGISDSELQDTGILIAKIPANTKAPALSFMAHLDTVDIGASPDVKAHLIAFTGEDFYLDNDKKILFKTEDYSHILDYKGDDIFVTDGTSVLGADDKAGVTVIMGIAKYFTTHDAPHGDIYLVFVPDEEIGLRGAKALDINKIPVEFSYTIDGSFLGNFNYETFNAASVIIKIEGVSIHPGRAKDVLVNPLLVAQDLIAQFDILDTPENSENYEGYFYFMEMTANPMEAVLDLNVRDFDLKKFDERKEYVHKIIKEIQDKYPRVKITYTMEDVYANIANFLATDRRPIEVVEKAMKNLNITMIRGPLRGGTDGSVLSSKGRMTPNIFTGSHNVHSIFEYLPLSSLEKSLEHALEVVKLIQEDYKS